jgi:hypothetical protein
MMSDQRGRNQRRERTKKAKKTKKSTYKRGQEKTKRTKKPLGNHDEEIDVEKRQEKVEQTTTDLRYEASINDRANGEDKEDKGKAGN